MDLKCKMCQELIPGGKQTLISHQKYECLRRPVTCQYCHLPFEYLQHAAHEQMCGSRTELCVLCNQYIALSLIESHSMDVHGVPYEAPMGIARMKSDESTMDAPMGGCVPAPDRDYDDIMNDGQVDDKETSDANERWICSSCDYNNRPKHTHCKICSVERTKYMKKVSEMDKSPAKKQKNIEKIGGNAQNVPNRNYDSLVSKTEEIPSKVGGIIKPPWFQYNEEQNDVTMASDIVIASGIDPSMIPKRDYDAMLNAEDIDDSAAFFHDNSANVKDSSMNDDDKMNLSANTNADVIPQRDYDSMLHKAETTMDIDSETEQQQLIEQMTKQMKDEEQHKNKAQYRSITAVIPQRNYDQMIQKNTETKVEMKRDGNTKSNKMITSSDGKWVCPSEDCDHLNKSTRNNCSVCHVLKPSYKRTAALLDDSIDNLGLDHRWVCKACNGLNKGSRANCVFCHKDKMYKPNGKYAAKEVIAFNKKKKRKVKMENSILHDVERWVCPNEECNFLNKGSRINCQVCHQQRKDQSLVWGDRKAKQPKNESNAKQSVVVENKSEKKEKSKKKKKAFVHPLEARMMGMDVDELHNVPMSNANRGSSSGQEWSCPICTFLNKSLKCEMCGCPKDGQ